MPNLFDVEDAFMQGSVEFDKVIAEFEAEWNEPMIIMAAGLDMWLNQDIYLGGVGNGEESEVPGTTNPTGGLPMAGPEREQYASPPPI